MGPQRRRRCPFQPLLISSMRCHHRGSHRPCLAPDRDGLSKQNDRNANPTAKEGQKVVYGTLAWATRKDREEAPGPLMEGRWRRKPIQKQENPLPTASPNPARPGISVPLEKYHQPHCLFQPFVRRECTSPLLCARLGRLHLLFPVLPKP